MSDTMESAPAPDAPAQQPQRRPANENPWYLLATLHGEQEEGVNSLTYNAKLHRENRRAWNRYIASGMGEPEIARLAALKDGDGNSRFKEEELVSYSEVERAELLDHFKTRLKKSLPKGASVPEDIKLPEGDADFSHTDFTLPFIATEFLFRKANFKNAVFSSLGNFGSARFSRGANFRNANFSKIADFRNATFSSMVDFINTSFSGYAHFDGATFSIRADFGYAKFFEAANYTGTTFSSRAEFINTTFSRHAIFKSVTFSSFSSFKNATFSNSAYFEHATFALKADFLNAKLQGDTSFAHAVFKSSPPVFHGATLHESAQWHGITWPDIPADPEEVQQHLYCYERLKQEMERLKKHEDEHFFFMQEARCREVRDGFPGNFFSRAYGFFSDYGRSTRRPVAGLLSTLALGAGAFLLTSGGNVKAGREIWRYSVSESFGLSFANTFWPLGLRKELFEAQIKAMGWLEHLVALAQGGGGLLFLFLLGLALRNRFRLK